MRTRVRRRAALGLLVVFGVLAAAGCAGCITDDGLPPAAWEARERAAALRRLPAVRAAFDARLPGLVAQGAPRAALAHLAGAPTDTVFGLGGAYRFGGVPRYARSCAGGDFRSRYSFNQAVAWATADSLVLLMVGASTTGVAEMVGAPPPHDPLSVTRRGWPLGPSVEIRYERAPGVSAGGAVVLRGGPRQPLETLFVAPADTARAAAFVAHVRAAARSG
jgi:hypothetical protein